MPFEFDVAAVAGQPVGLIAAARAPDFLVSVPAGHALLSLGAAFFRVGGAAAPPAAGAPPVLDRIPLAALEGLVGDAIAAPPGAAAPLFGSHAFDPAFLERVVDRALDGATNPDVQTLIDGVMRLAREGGITFDPAADIVALEPFALPGAAGERPARPHEWSASYSLASVPFNRMSDDDGLLGAYAALRRAGGLPGTIISRRNDPFASVARSLSGLSPRLDLSVLPTTWERDRVLASVTWLVGTPWPSELMMMDVYSSSTRAAADLADRAAYFIGEASMRLRVIRSRFPRFLLAHSTLLRILGVASPADAWRLGCTLAERVEPGADLSSLHVWGRVERRMAECSNVLLEAGGVADSSEAVDRILNFLDVRQATAGSSFSAGSAPGVGGGGGSGPRSRATGVVDVVNGAAVAGPSGLLMSLRRATAVSQPEVLSVALASQLQPILKYLLDGKEKAPIDHEIFSVLGSALHALPEYFRLQACVDDDGAICGPTDDSSLARATKFKLSDTFIKALKCGDWVSVLDGAVHEYRNWHAAFKVACPSITDVVHDLHQNPDMIVFLDRIFSSVGYPRQSAVADASVLSIGGVLARACSHIRRAPRTGHHNAAARTLVYEVVKMSSLEYKRFIGDAGCNDAMPAFSSTTWAPFKSVTAQEGVGDTLRAIDDYAPSFVDLALGSSLHSPPAAPYGTAPKRAKVHFAAHLSQPPPFGPPTNFSAGLPPPTLCALPGCYAVVYPGKDYCCATHAIAGGALVPHSAPAPPAASPFSGPPPPPRAPPSSAFMAPGPADGLNPFAPGGAHSGLGLAPPAGKGKGTDGRGRGSGGKGKGRGRGNDGDGRGRGRGRDGSQGLSFSQTVRNFRASSGGQNPRKGQFSHFVKHNGSHVGVQFGATPTVINKSAAGTFSGCGPDDKCWGVVMCLAQHSALALCEDPANHADNDPAHFAPTGFHDALNRGDFR